MTENATPPPGWRAEKRRLGKDIERRLRALEAEEYERFLRVPPDTPGRDHCLVRAGALKEAREAVMKLFRDEAGTPE